MRRPATDSDASIFRSHGPKRKKIPGRVPLHHRKRNPPPTAHMGDRKSNLDRRYCRIWAGRVIATALSCSILETRSPGPTSSFRISDGQRRHPLG
jgi:hypothetical protein